MEQLGPFLDTILMAVAALASIVILRRKLMGPAAQWAETAKVEMFDFVVPSKILSCVLILAGWAGMYYVDFRIFFIIAVGLGVASFFLLKKSRYNRALYIFQHASGDYLFKGTEDEMKPQAKSDYQKAAKQGPISIESFMDGYGNPPNDPLLIWEDKTIVDHGKKVLDPLLMATVCAIVGVFLASNAGVWVLKEFGEEDSLDDVTVDIEQTEQD